jgi:protein involved in polysaccharide export with SLBB domain
MANYTFARPNDITIIVNVLGHVQRPGRYEISKSIDLVNLLALAGGPTPDGSASSVRITRFLGDQRARPRTITLDLDELSDLLPPELVLHPGDVIQVDRSGWATVRDVFTVVVSAAIITGAIAQVIYASNR